MGWLRGVVGVGGRRVLILSLRASDFAQVLSARSDDASPSSSSGVSSRSRITRLSRPSLSVPLHSNLLCTLRPDHARELPDLDVDLDGLEFVDAAVTDSNRHRSRRRLDFLELGSSSGFDGSVDVADDGGRGFGTSDLEAAVESFRFQLRGGG